MAGDFSYIVKKRGVENIEILEKKWAIVFNKHIKAHGLPETYMNYIKLMRKASELYNQAYHGKKWVIVKARIAEAEAVRSIQAEGERIEVTCARISKYLGFPIKADKCSVSEFYGYLSMMQ